MNAARFAATMKPMVFSTRSFFALVLTTLACGARSEIGDGAPPQTTTAIDPTTIEAARPLAPLSTSTTASLTPTLHWKIPESADAVELELCADRACARSLAKIQTASDHARVPSLAGERVVFWRLRGMKDGVVGASTSTTWELFTSARDAQDAAWGAVPDFNGDGLADWALGAWGASTESGDVELFYGRAGDVAQTPDVTLHGDASSSFGSELTTIGDIDGDGFPELAIVSQAGVSIYAGGPSGIAAVASRVVPVGVADAVGSAGDVDGDGYGDFFVGPQGAPLVVYFGGAKPSTRTRVVPTPIASPAYTFATTGNVDADGRPDLCAGESALDESKQAHVIAADGATIDLPTEPGLLVQVDCRGDVNGDGFSDVVVVYDEGDHGLADVFLGGPSGVALTPQRVTFDGQYGANESVKGAPIALGDFDHDGRDDLVAGVLGRRLAVISGSAQGLDASTQRIVALPGGATSGDLSPGIAPNVVSGGDIDGDGIVDLVAGAQGYWLDDDTTQTIADPGHAWVYPGAPNSGLTPTSTPAVTLAGPGDDELTFGCDVE